MRIRFTFFFVLLSGILTAQELKSPSEFLGYELGSRFTRHHRVIDYYQYVANTLPGMVKTENYGMTYEQRPLMLAFISTEENIKNLENLRQEHLKNTRGEGNSKTAIVWLSYNVHGNESVGTEASMQTLYELLTSKRDWLSNTIVIIDPCINPDGRDRYVNWYHQFGNAPHQVDPNSKEHREPWLSGRPNHYMFDLNRDWAWITQIESKQRLKVFNQWLPHVHVDFHEQGVDAPYYFAPAAEPFHEIITPWQREFQVTMGKNHARYFDREGWFYFTKEVFDLLYPSYGDTYPTYNGGIGMTYEQGGSGRAGLGITTSYGDTLTLKDRIAHHHTTGLSTVEVSANNAEKLNAEFKKFYTNTSFTYKSYVLKGDRDKIKILTELLDAHEITYGFAQGNTVKGYDYTLQRNGSMKTTANDLVVSTNQVKGKLVKVLFEPKTKLSDSLTYDITAWSLPYAYGLQTIASESLVNSVKKEHENTPVALSDNTYAYVTDWSSMKDARFLADLLKENIRVRFHSKPFIVEGKSYERGSLIITRLDNKNLKNFKQKLSVLATKHQKSLTPTSTGFVDEGKDFGSGSVNMIPKSRIAILAGGSVSTLNFGEVWHFFEQQLGYPVTVLDKRYYNRVKLSDYDIIILPELWGSSYFNENQLKDLNDWIRKGGKLIAIGGALESLVGANGFSIRKKSAPRDTIADLENYQSGERNYIKYLITGAVFKAKLDPTHPLAFGYNDTYFTLRLQGDAYEYLENGNVAYIQSEGKPVSGFAGSQAQKLVPESLVFGVEQKGAGCVIYMADNPLFRGFWENGKLFFANALFMVNNR